MRAGVARDAWIQKVFLGSQRRAILETVVIGICGVTNMSSGRASLVTCGDACFIFAVFHRLQYVIFATFKARAGGFCGWWILSFSHVRGGSPEEDLLWFEIFIGHAASASGVAEIPRVHSIVERRSSLFAETRFILSRKLWLFPSA